MHAFAYMNTSSLPSSTTSPDAIGATPAMSDERPTNDTARRPTCRGWRSQAAALACKKAGQLLVQQGGSLHSCLNAAGPNTQLHLQPALAAAAAGSRQLSAVEFPCRRAGLR